MTVVLIVCAYVVIWIVAAYVLYPWAVDDGFAGPQYAAALGGLLWPVVLALLVAFVPFWLIGKLVERGPR